MPSDRGMAGRPEPDIFNTRQTDTGILHSLHPACCVCANKTESLTQMVTSIDPVSGGRRRQGQDRPDKFAGKYGCPEELYAGCLCGWVEVRFHSSEPDTQLNVII